MANYYLNDDGTYTKKRKKTGKHYVMQSDGTIKLEEEPSHGGSGRRRGEGYDDIAPVSSYSQRTSSAYDASNSANPYAPAMQSKREESLKKTVADKDREKILNDTIPVIQKEEKGLDFFQAGGFSSENGLWDNTKAVAGAILGTPLDLGLGAMKGVSGMVEGLTDAGRYGVAGVADFFGADEYADKVRKTAMQNTVNDLFKPAEEYLDQFSILGDTSYSIAQGLGQVGAIVLTGGAGSASGLGALGTTALTTGTMGVSSAGSGMSEAYNAGATDEEALKYGVAKGAIDAGTELLFGGLGKAVGAVGLSKGISSLDDVFAQKLSSRISNQYFKNLVEFGVKASGEGVEEVLAGIGTAVAQKLTYMDEKELGELIADQDLLEQFVVGMVTSGIAQSGIVPGMKGGGLIESNKAGTDFITGYTQNEQAVVDKVVADRVAEQQKDGEKLSKKDIGKIEEAVKKELERGEIDIDTIESVLGGDTYSQYNELLAESQEYEELYNTKSGDLSKKQSDRLAELSEKNKNTPYDMELSNLREKLSKEVRTTTENDAFLLESYNEKGRRSQQFEADLSKYDEKQQETIKSAIDSGILNNTRKTHEFVDMIAKLSAEKGVSFNFTNNQALKESGFAMEGKTVNGYVNADKGIVLNIESAKALNTVVGHEVTHVLEGTKLYDELQTAIFEYAKSKGDFDTRSEAIKSLYEGRFEGTPEQIQEKLNKELTADLVGDYLFTDSDFINNLSTTKPNVFKRVYNEIKYLLKVATAGSKEARQLEKVKKAFDKAFKENNSAKVEEGSVNFSLANKNIAKDAKIPVVENTDYKSVPKNDYKLLNDLQNEVKNLKRGTYENKATGYKADINAKTINKILSPTHKFDPWKGHYLDNLNASRYLPTLFENAVYVDTKENQKSKNANKQVEGFHHFVAPIRMNGNDYRVRITAREKANSDTLYIVDAEILQTKSNAVPNNKNGNISALPSDISVSDLVNGVKIFDYNLQQNNVYTDADIKFSLSEDSEGRTISPAVQKRFANSKAVDKNGSLKVLYHGTPSGEFTIFDKSKGSIEGDFGSGFYFTDNETDVEVNYEGGGPDFENKVARRAEQIEAEEEIDYDEAEQRAREELYKGSNKFEVYLNIENPAIVGKTVLLDQESYLENYDPDDYDDYDDYIADVDQLVNDDIENIVWEVEKNVDLYSTDGIAEVLYDAYYNGGIGIEDLKTRINELYLEDNEGNLAGNEVTRQIIESLGYDGIIDSTVSSKFSNMGLEEGTTHYIVFKPNQIKSITNENPTDNPDINLSLSGKNDIAPVGNYNVYGKDIALETVSEMESVATVVQEKTDLVQEVVQETDEYAPMTEAEANERDAMQGDRLYSLDENDMPDEIAPVYDELNEVEAVSPFDDKDIQDVGNRKQKAYMYENPEVKPYFQEEAQVMLGELRNSVKGERVVNADLLYESNGELGVWGTKRETSEQIAYMLDRFKYSYADIEKGLNAIIEDHGAENNAISKRLEFMIDERLREGYTDFLSGMEIPSNQDYINLLRDKQINNYTDEAYNQYLESFADHFRDTTKMIDAPVVDDIAPTKAYEAIEPRPMTTSEKEAEYANNKMKRATTPLDAPKERRFIASAIESEVVDGKIQREDLDQRLTIYEPISNKKTLSNANAMLDNYGYEKAVTYFESQLMNKRTTLDDIALGERLIQEAIKKEDYATAGELIQNVAILGTELGQKVQALSLINRLTPEGQLKMLQKTVNRGKTKGDKAFEGVEITQEMIDHILSVYGKDGKYDQKKLDEAVEDVKQKVADQMKVTKMDKINAWRYLSMLGNPKTHIRNLVSNVAMRGTLKVKNALARTIEDIAPIKDKTKTWRRATDDVKAFVDETAIEMKDVISDDSKYSEEASIKAKRDTFKNKILNKVYEFNSDMLSKEDWWFSRPAFKDALGEFLTANGIRTKEDIANNKEIVEKAKNYAVEQSQIATFRQYSWLANKIREIEKKNTATDIAVGSILPFKKTPINIAKAGLNYSPLGFAKTLTYDISKVKKGEMDASTMIDNLAQNTTGTALTLIGYMLAMSGLLNGAGDDDKEGKYDYQLGKQAYSLNIGGATYSLSWLSPVAMPMFVGANAYEQLVEGKEWNGDVVMETLAQTLDPLSEMSFLSSLDSVLSSYDSGMQKFAGIGQTMVQNYATQFIPTLSSQVATAMDDKKRSTKVAGDSGNKFLEETYNKLIYKIPGLRETLEPSTDIWGNEIKQTESVVGRALETFFAPYSKKGDISTEIDNELKSLYAETGDAGLLPNIPYNYVNYQNEKYEMSAEEYTDYKKTYGQTAYNLMEELFETTTYQDATTEDRVEMVNKVYDYARDEAKKEYLAKEGVEYTNSTSDGVPYYKENAIKGAVENDLLLDEFNFYDKYPAKYEWLQSIDVSFEEYNASKESKEAYNWAFENPDKYYVSKAVAGDVVTYREYAKEINKIEADKDDEGKTIKDSRKNKVIAYIDSLDIDYGAKLIMLKTEYSSFDDYDYEILEYLDSRDDITYEEMLSIVKELGFTVNKDGTISW